jgi:trehalose 6-phosphate synthase
MSDDEDLTVLEDGCEELQIELLKKWALIIAANRAPVTLRTNEEGEIEFQRGGGGLVTALMGLVQHVEATWIASAITEEDRAWKEGTVPLNDEGDTIRVRFVLPKETAYDMYYNVISNPLLWFLQHNMWNIARAPTINRETWKAWEEGYVAVNQLFANAIAKQIRSSKRHALVMLQDYQLYLAPALLRKKMRTRKGFTLTHFVHIPWPGAEDWGILPPTMRRQILEGLCAVDLLGFQTRDDGLNFIRTVETHLPRAHVNYRRGRIWFRNHSTYVRDFPISIDVSALKRLAESDEVANYREQIIEAVGDRQLIVRIDRTEPSKNIVRGFQAMDELLELYPDYKGKVQFLALLVPSRMEVEEYQNYLDELMAAAGRVNARHGESEWEPVRVMVGENYPRAIAALQLYDALLVNSIADGMNLVAKEGPIVNRKHGVVILSERTGARQQLESGATVISPCDVYATAEAMHQALVMSAEQREERAHRLKWMIERDDISAWFCNQLKKIDELNL